MEKGFFLTAVGSQLELSSMGFDYTHYLNANLQMSEWAGCNSSHLVSAIMEEVAQMHHSNGCRARVITRGSTLTWPSFPPCLRLLCPLEVVPEAEVKPVFKKDSQFLGQDQAMVSAPPPFVSSYRVWLPLLLENCIWFQGWLHLTLNFQSLDLVVLLSARVKKLSAISYLFPVFSQPFLE